ncbi:hypothetical protein AYI70_g12178 [Smittium culicis]|uniref:Sacsin/Nov domain-containing protein n=1 Tax=Smittium culicis TaxID=133412 RepID=A0A1R1WYI3_9FUNG|nr:hypothetical protein AYI70_g12178 [Smittium culicis]
MFSTFRDKVIADDSLEEKVEVNQRHLIDKILARYSAEYTVFRELLQNANDAEASELKIRFITSDFSKNHKENSQNELNFESNHYDSLFSSNKSFTSVGESVINNSVTLNEKYTTIIVSNNGKKFSGQDWNRLKKIAEGNPDEQKIGFFGVGFYSLFSICEEPFVISGDDCMAFYWKGDQLFTKKFNKGEQKVGLESDETPWTWFIMQIRDDPTPVPDPARFGRFLSTALAFTKSLKTVSVIINNHEVFKVNKTQKDFSNQNLMSEAGFLGFKKEKYILESPQRLFGIKNINKHTFLIECSYIHLHKETSIINELGNLVGDIFKGKKDTAALSSNSAFLDRKLGGFFSSWINPFRSNSDDSKNAVNSPNSQEAAQKITKTVESVKLVLKTEFIILKIAEAGISVDVPSKMALHMERATKKPPPKFSTMQVIWGINSELEKENNRIETASQSNNPDLAVLGQLAAYPQQGSVFIGFATHQTTGCSAHLAAQFIPTVERESIDFIDPALAKWNRELLSIFGIMCRILHDSELEFLSRKFKELNDEIYSAKNKTSIIKMLNLEKFTKLSLHSAQTLNFFTPRYTTPSNLPGELLSNVFFACSRDPIPILSSCGVVPATKARLYLPIDSNTIMSIDSIKSEWKKTNGNFPSLLNLIYNLPIIPPETVVFSKDMLLILKDLGQINVMTVKDVIADISSSDPMSPDEAVGIIYWWSSLSHSKFSYQTSFINSIKINCSLADYTNSKAPSQIEKYNSQLNTQLPTFTFYLNQARYFINPKTFPIFDLSLFEPFLKTSLNPNNQSNYLNLPYPLSVIPLSVSLKFKSDTLQSLFNGADRFTPLSELPVKLWLDHILSDRMMFTIYQTPIINEAELESTNLSNLSHDTDGLYPISHTVLSTIAKLWPRMPLEDRVMIVSTIDNIKFIPTINGLQKPGNSYFPSANLFPDLSIVLRSVIKVTKENVLTELGVKKHVDLQLVFDRIDTELKWDHIQLVKYLTSVSETLTELEYKKLRSARIFPALESNRNIIDNKSQTITSTPIKYRADQLYFPSDKVSNLGIPVLKWNRISGPSFADSKEGIFLSRLGMKVHPNILELLIISSQQPLNTPKSTDIDLPIDSDSNLRIKALDYLLENFDKVYSNDYSSIINQNDIPFLPVYSASLVSPSNENSSLNSITTYTSKLEHPHRCFSNPSCMVMKFPILDKRWRRNHDKLGVPLNPSVNELLARISNYSFSSYSEAVSVFEYLSSRQADFTDRDWVNWKKVNFIPVFDKEKTIVTKKLLPTKCYFQAKSDEISSKSTSGFEYKNLFFTTIDFGPKAALFLRACGVRDEPLPVDLANQLVSDPNAFLLACNNSYEVYTELIKKIASSSSELQGHPQTWRSMQETAWLVASQKRKISITDTSLKLGDKTDSSGPKNDSVDEETIEYTLSKPRDIVIIDDTFLAQQLYPKSAPSDPLLEQFYLSLGSTWLRQSVRISNIPIGNPEITNASITLEKIIKDRAPLLLNEFKNSSSRSNNISNYDGHESSRHNTSGKSSKLIRDIEFMQNKLVVRQVQRIEVKHEFKLTGSVYKTLTSACGVNWDAQRGAYTDNKEKANWNMDITSLVSAFSSKSSISSSGLTELFTNDNSKWCCILIAQPTPSTSSTFLPPEYDGQPAQFWDSFDVGMAIGVLFLKQCRLNDALLISTLLSSSLDGLRRKGFPVDRILLSTKKKTDLLKSSIIAGNKSVSTVSSSTREPSSEKNIIQNSASSINGAGTHGNPPPYDPKLNLTSSEISNNLIAILTSSYPKSKRSQIVDAVMTVMKQYNLGDNKNNQTFEDLLKKAEDILSSESLQSKPSKNYETNSQGLLSGKNNFGSNIPNNTKNNSSGTASISGNNPKISNYANNNHTQKPIINKPNSHEVDSSFISNPYSNMLSIKQSLDNAVKSTPSVSGAKGMPSHDVSAPSTSPSLNESNNRLSKLFGGINKLYNKNSNPLLNKNNNALPSEFALNPNQDGLGNAISKYPDDSPNNPLFRPNDSSSDYVSNSVNFCKPLSSQRLKYFGLVNGIDLYLDSKIDSPESYSILKENYIKGYYGNIKFPRSHSSHDIDSFKLFSCLLTQLAEKVFGMPKESMHMFIGGIGCTTIAFNRSKVLFFNIDYFINLNHNISLERILFEHKGKSGHSSQPGFSIENELNSIKLSGKDVRDVYAYWFMTTCHELAHHFVHDHDAQHGFYTSSFAETYMAKLIELLA